MKTKTGKTLLCLTLLCLGMICLLGCSKPEQGNEDHLHGSDLMQIEEIAARAAEELKTMQEMGLLSHHLDFTDMPPIMVFPVEADTMDEYYLHREREAGHMVRWDNGRYRASVRLDESSGKLSAMTFEVLAAEDETPTREVEQEHLQYNEETGKDELVPVSVLYYDNYAELFPETITIDEFCDLLCQYWGFDSYSLAPTVDSFYSLEEDPPAGETRLKDMDMGQNGYLTVFFEGDQDGVPRYIQLADYPNSNVLVAGTGHLNG